MSWRVGEVEVFLKADNFQYMIFFLGLRLSLFLHLPQHGFHKHRSCETQPDITWHEINYLIDSGEEVDAVVLDFSNAFDKVSHPKLIFKLQNLGISTLLVDWIANWLKDRSQVVSVNGTKSEK